MSSLGEGSVDADAQAGLSRGQIGLAMYALITTSVVLAGADEHSAFEIAGLMVGQALALTLAHGYAESIAHQTTLKSGVAHSVPILVAAAPAALVGLVLGVMGLHGELAVYVGLLVNLVGLVSLQGLATRRVGFTWSRLAGAALLDTVAILTVLAIIKLLK